MSLETKAVATEQPSVATSQTKIQKVTAFLGNHKREIAVIATGAALVVGCAFIPAVPLVVGVGVVAIISGLALVLASPFADDSKNSLQEKAQKGKLTPIQLGNEHNDVPSKVQDQASAGAHMVKGDAGQQPAPAVIPSIVLANPNTTAKVIADQKTDDQQKLAAELAKQQAAAQLPDVTQPVTEPTQLETLNALTEVVGLTPKTAQPYSPIKKVAIGTVGVAALAGIGYAAYSGVQNHNLAVQAAAKAQADAQNVYFAGFRGYTDAAQKASANAGSWESYTPSAPGMPNFSGLTSQLPGTKAVKETVFTGLSYIPGINRFF